MNVIVTGTWADVRPGDVVLVRGVRYVVESPARPGAVTMRPQSGGASRTGDPSPSGRVRYSRPERDPEPTLEVQSGGPCTDPLPAVEGEVTFRQAVDILSAAGFEVTVIERVMSHAELESHLGDVHGVALPARGKLTLFEDRQRLADLHFELHADGQPLRGKWQPRGRARHVHPVMDRPTHGT